MNTMLSGALGIISGPLKNLLDQLAGEKNEMWVEILKLMSRMTPEQILAGLKAAALKTWKKIPVGGGTRDELLGKLKVAHVEVCNRTDDIVRKPVCTFPTEVEEGVEFIMGSLDYLFGFKKDTTQIFLDEEYLAKHGLELCKPTDASYLRLAHLDQRLREWIHVGMTPILAFDEQSRTLLLGNETGLHLYAGYARTEQKFHSDSLWCFRRKVAQS